MDHDVKSGYPAPRCTSVHDVNGRSWWEEFGAVEVGRTDHGWEATLAWAGSDSPVTNGRVVGIEHRHTPFSALWTTNRLCSMLGGCGFAHAIVEDRDRIVSEPLNLCCCPVLWGVAKQRPFLRLLTSVGG